jgi:hypothetical protein
MSMLLGRWVVMRWRSSGGRVSRVVGWAIVVDWERLRRVGGFSDF